MDLRGTIQDLTYEELISERDRLYRKKYEEGLTQEDDERLVAVMEELGDTIESMADKWI